MFLEMYKTLLKKVHKDDEKVIENERFEYQEKFKKLAFKMGFDYNDGLDSQDIRLNEFNKECKNIKEALLCNINKIHYTPDHDWDDLIDETGGSITELEILCSRFFLSNAHESSDCIYNYYYARNPSENHTKEMPRDPNDNRIGRHDFEKAAINFWEGIKIYNKFGRNFVGRKINGGPILNIEELHLWLIYYINIKLSRPKIKYPQVTPKGKEINLIPIYEKIINEIENQIVVMNEKNKSRVPCFH